MEFKTLEVLREHVIAEQEADGYRVIAHDWGFGKLTSETLQRMANATNDEGQAASFRHALERGFQGEHSLWALVERPPIAQEPDDLDDEFPVEHHKGLYRYLYLWLVMNFPDGCYVRKELYESAGPFATDVPWSVWQHVRQDDAGAEPRWREIVANELAEAAR